MANNNALIAIAAAATALAAAATALVSGDNSCGNAAATPSVDEPAPEETQAPTKRRGRPPGSTAPAETKQEEPEAEKKPVGKTIEELRALIEPLVKGGQGDDVKKVIAKYAPKLGEIDPKDHAAFAKDIEALNM